MKIEFDVKDGEKKYVREETITIGQMYLCTQSYTPTFKSDLPSGYNRAFTKNTWYELNDVSNLHATFICDAGTRYFLNTYVEGTLFKHFDFSKTYAEYIKSVRKKKIDNVLGN